MSGIHNPPPHPGKVLMDTVLRHDGGMSVTEFADKLGMTRTQVSRIANCKAGISAAMAIRLEAALGTSAETWLGMQAAYDIWQERKIRSPKVKRIEFEERETEERETEEA